jgi:glycosyltransferase involved in cell wall biosynthesis
VLVVTSSAERRGAQTEALLVAEGLTDLGIDATVVALAPAGSGGLDVEVLGRGAMAPATLLALRRRATHHDLVLAWGSTTLPACAVALAGHTPWIYRSIGDPGAWVRGRVHRERTGLLLRRARTVVALWPEAADQLAQLYRIDHARIEVIPNGRDAARFTPITPTERAEARAELGLEADDRVAVVLGALSAEKQIDQAIEAVAALDGVVLLVAGGGPQRTALEERARRRAPGRVRFLGSVADPAALLAAADALLLTSRTEGQPAVVLEALFRGVPVAASRVGAVEQLVQPERTGFLFEAGDVAGATAALEAAIALPMTAVLGERQRIAERFDGDVVTAQWAQLLARHR